MAEVHPESASNLYFALYIFEMDGDLLLSFLVFGISFNQLLLSFADIMNEHIESVYLVCQRNGLFITLNYL